ncbi:hypothetical protein DB346_09965 [Verrucomicrobia bacterium LW23]|nr:hypothetical protein DB346_09965 [Verrucomicrobia bacterium LW23]
MSVSLRRKKDSFTLIAVLVSIAVTALLICAFLQRAISDTRITHSQLTQLHAQQLRDSAVDIAIAQIRDATSQRGVAWISQPGLIRTFAGDGSPATSYKLYTAEAMSLPGNEFPLGESTAAAEIPADWIEHPDDFVDLNQALATSFPTGGAPPTPGTLRCPIMTPTRPGATAVPGYAADPAIPGLATSETHPLPMPVRWLYVLSDGSLVVRNPTTGELPGASADNPVTGRIAFWCDDETCKININTAAGGAFWTPPTDVTWQGAALSWAQPVDGEFSRYPGHPAATALDLVLNETLFFPLLNPTERRQRLLALAPMLEPGGSLEGTRASTSHPLAMQGFGGIYASGTLPSSSTATVLPDAPSESVGTYLNACGRSGGLDAADVQRELPNPAFFLTARSRAPDVTLFGTPRVSLWPIWTNTSRRTGADRLAVASSTIGPADATTSFVVQRADSQSPTADFDDITANQLIFRYLQAITDAPVPGFGASLRAKVETGPGRVAGERDQILTSILDAIRTFNVADTTPGATPFAPGYSATGHALPGAGQVTPLRIGTRQGLGRMTLVAGATMVFSGTGALNPAEPSGAAGQLRMLLMLNGMNPGAGHPQVVDNLRHVVTGLAALKVRFPSGDEAALFPGDSYVNEVRCGPHAFAGGGDRWRGPALLGEHFLMSGPGAVKPLNRTPGPGSYPFFSETLPVPVSGTNFPTSFEFLGGTVRVETQTASGQLVQTTSLQLQPFTAPLPRTHTDMTTRLLTFSYPANSPKLFPSPAHDIVRSIEPIDGDLRVIAARPVVDTSFFRPHRDYANATNRVASIMTTGTNAPAWGRMYRDINVIGSEPPIAFAPSAITNGIARADGGRPDFDSGLGRAPDGPGTRRVDEGTPGGTGTLMDEMLPTSYTGYLVRATNASMPTASAMRQVAGPVVLGGLPTGTLARRPWETLLFRPATAETAGALERHPGAATPPDHLWLDLFTMPVVEPWAISARHSTAGRVNLNQQIFPFTYVRRNTALRAVLRDVRISAKKADALEITETKGASGAMSTRNTLYALDLDRTMAGIDSRERGRPFISASEICEVPLVPALSPAGIPILTSNAGTTTVAQTTYNSISSFLDVDDFWRQAAVTGDNLRESPYAHLHPRLTTQSNTFTVHYWVQPLRNKKMPGVDPTRFFEQHAEILAELRGSAIVERYLETEKAAFDPADPLKPLGPYRFRLLNQQRIW